MSIEELGKKVKHLDYMLHEVPNVVRFGTYDYQLHKLMLDALKEIQQILEEDKL